MAQTIDENISKDTVKTHLFLNSSLFGPLLHPGFLVGLDLPLREKTKTKERGKLAMKMGLREKPKIKTVRNGLYVEPHLGLYNHRFNHTGLLFGTTLKLQHQFNSGLYYFGGFELGRLIRFHRDVVVFDERNNPDHRNVVSSGHYQLGVQPGLGFRFKKGQSVFYKYHIGLIFPFNHLAGGYVRHELGVNLIQL